MAGLRGLSNLSALLVAVLTVSCLRTNPQFEDEAPDDGDGSSGAVVPSLGEGTTTGSVTQTGDSSETSDDGASDSDAVGESTNAGTLGCDAQRVSRFYPVADAQITSPMIMTEGWGALYGQNVAFSKNAEDGTVTFDVEVECSTSYGVWALVWDLFPGGAGCGVQHADSFLATIDDGQEMLFLYGCSDCSAAAKSWSWRRVHHWDGDAYVCSTFEEIEARLGPGRHTITLRNREASRAAFDVAAIAAIAISNDPNFDPAIDWPSD